MFLAHKPWWPNSAINFLINTASWTKKLSNISQLDDVVFEIGGGGSTLLHLKLGYSVIVLENNAIWKSLISESALTSGFKVFDNLSSFQNSKEKGKLLIFSTSDWLEVIHYLDLYKYAYVVVDGDFRYEAVKHYNIVGLSRIGFLILDNLEYCASYGVLPISAGFPERVVEYRRLLKNNDFRHLILSDENHLDLGSIDNLCPHYTGIIFSVNSLLNEYLVSSSGVPLLSPAAKDNNDVIDLRARCIYPSQENHFFAGKFTLEKK